MKNFSRNFLMMVGFALLLLVSHANQSFAQEGIITPLSTGDYALSIVHQSNVGAITALTSIDLTRNDVIAAIDGDSTVGDVLMVYSGSKSLLPEVEVQAMNTIGYDVSGLSREDLSGDLALLADALANADFPHVVSNVSFEIGSELEALVQPFTITNLDTLRSGALGGGIYPGLMIETEALNVCVFGLVDSNSNSAMPSAVVVDDAAEAAQTYVDTCEANDADLVVALLSLSTTERLDTQIKQSVAGVDVFVMSGAGTVLDPQNDAANSAASTDKGMSISIQDNGLGRLDVNVNANQLTTYQYQSSYEVSTRSSVPGIITINTETTVDSTAPTETLMIYILSTLAMAVLLLGVIYLSL